MTGISPRAMVPTGPSPSRGTADLALSCQCQCSTDRARMLHKETQNGVLESLIVTEGWVSNAKASADNLVMLIKSTKSY